MSCTSFLFCFETKQNKKNDNIIKKKSHINNLKFLRRDSIAISSEYSELKYWFSEFVKYTITDYNTFENKDELLETVWKYTDIIKVSEYYSIYKSNYSGEYSEKNMLKFYKTFKDEDSKFLEFVNDILRIANTYSVSGFT